MVKSILVPDETVGNQRIEVERSRETHHPRPQKEQKEQKEQEEAAEKLISP
jgi:hypothetical protein